MSGNNDAKREPNLGLTCFHFINDRTALWPKPEGVDQKLCQNLLRFVLSINAIRSTRNSASFSLISSLLSTLDGIKMINKIRR